MSPSPTTLRLLGYDPVVAARLPTRDRHRLRNLGVAWVASCALLGAAAGYAGWLIVPHPLSPIAGGGAIFLLALNLVRVVTAGGGVALADGDPEVTCARYHPSWAPAAVLAVLAALLAQPAQLQLWSHRIDPLAEEHRRELLEDHAAAARALGVTSDEGYQELRTASFIVFRLGVLWERPDQAIRWTALFVFLIVLPDLWARSLAIESLRAYQRMRARDTGRRVEALGEELRAAQHLHLGRFPTYRPDDRGGPS